MSERQIVHHYDAAWIDDVVPPYVLSLQAPLCHLGLSHRGKVLDLGCGNGVLGHWLRQAFGCQVWGTEISEVAAARARERGYVKVSRHSLEV